jgi:acyl-CoA synthetase (NDP forming)
VSTGNEADLGVADGIRAVTELDGVRAVAVVLETVRDGPAFVESIRDTISAGIPVVVCRIGTSDRGTAMTATHTGAMARPSRILDGVLDTLGVTIAETPGEMLDVAEVMARAALPAGDRVGVVTHSGGIAILLSDLAEREGVELPIPGEGLRRRLDSLLDHGTASNPLDMGGIIGGPGRFGEVVDAFDRSGEFDLVVATSTAHPRAHTVERVRGLLDSPSDRVIHLWMAGDVGREGLDMLRAAHRPVTEEPRALIRAVAGLVRMRKAETPPPAAAPGDQAGMTPPSGEFESKRFLAEWGMPVPEGGRAATAEDAASLAERLGGEVVVKLDSPDILHKTEVGGVRVGLEDRDAVAQAFTEMTGEARAARPDAEITGVIVERRTSGFEVILGGIDDPLFGPMMLVGLGGIAAEGFGPPAIAPAPLSVAGAARLLDRAPGLAHALTRVGTGAADALAALMSEMSVRFAGSRVDEFEVNPLAWTGDGWVALDAIVSTAERSAGNRSDG